MMSWQAVVEKVTVFFMNEGDKDFYNLILRGIILSAIFVFASSFIRNIPTYGKLAAKDQKVPLLMSITIGHNLSWFLMESPSFFIGFILYFFFGPTSIIYNPPNFILMMMFLLHYANRSFIYPWTSKASKPWPLVLTFCAALFTSINGYIQARYHGFYASAYPLEWLYDPRFIMGSLIFLWGFWANRLCDRILSQLRSPSDPPGTYKIPQGFMFQYISSANYFCEIVEWIGFAIASWSLAGTAFALFTFCNTAPRAYHAHQFYLAKFKDQYPKNRKALIPFLW